MYTDHTAAPVILIEKLPSRTEYFTVVSGGGSAKKRTITEERKERRGLTQAAAYAGAAVLASATVTAVARHSVGPMWTLETVEITTSAWEDA